MKGGAIAAIVVVALAQPGAGWAASPNAITIGAATPNASNCFPFGGFLADGGWGPNFAFVYKDIPAFDLRSGDVVAYDLNAPNDTDNRMDVAMAGTTVNGNDVNKGPFATVATSAQTPANPRGDSVTGNYELQWTASAPFDFGGGGLLVRFSNPAGPFATDNTCDANIGGASGPGDASGFFVGRESGDADGVSPWDVTFSDSIAQFRLILQPTSNDFAVGKVKRNPRKGTARLAVQVSGPGTLTLSGKGLKARTAAAPSAKTSVGAAGTVKLTVKPKGKLRSKLLTSHKARVALAVTFKPAAIPGHNAGDPRTARTKVKLVSR